MRSLLAFLLMLPALAWGQSRLPACPTDPNVRWHDCFGSLTTPGGQKYIGEFRDDKPHGQGTNIFPDGDKYVGEYREGKRHGRGTYSWADGRKHIGEYRDGSVTGLAILYAADGTIIQQGRWEKDELVQSFPLDPNRYPFNPSIAAATSTAASPPGSSDQSYLPRCTDKGMKHECFGTYQEMQGKRYVGEFRDGRYHGLGILYLGGGKVDRSGRWEENRLIDPFALDPGRFPFHPPAVTEAAASSQPTPLSPAQSALPSCPTDANARWHDCVGTRAYGDQKYTGEFREGKPNGRGVRIYPNGARYEGEEKDGKKHGRGMYTFSSGANYVGDYRDDKPNGRGKYTWPDGRRHVGEYRDGKVTGLAILYAADGSVLQQGRWESDKLVQTIVLDRTRFPFDTLATDSGRSEQERLAEEERRRQREFTQRQAEAREQQAREQQAREQQAREQQAREKQAQRPQATARNERRLALVIGNDGYQSVPRLLNARADAKAMARQLDAAGFRVTLRFDLSERAMKDALRTFRTSVEGGDEVVVFFAGHGVQLGAANYLLPVDIRGDSEEQVKDEAIPLQRILDDLSDRKARFSLAIVDACRDNPFKTSGRSIGGRGLAPAAAASGQMVIFSAGAGQQALDRLNDKDSDPNGLFTRIFLKEMARPGVSIDRVVRTVRNEVVQMAKSVGHEQVPALYDQTLGDFFFIR